MPRRKLPLPAPAQADPPPPPDTGEAVVPKGRMGALDRVLQVLDQLQAVGSPMTAYDIARSAEAPLSTIYTLIDGMVERGLLVRRDDRTLWLGNRLYMYGLAYAGSIDFLTAASDEMLRLSREVEETVQICGRDEGMMVVLQMAEGPGHFRVTSRVGSRLPINWTASGRVLVGHLPQAQRTAFFAKYSRPSPTGLAETSPSKLARISAQAFAQRLSVQIGESEASVACLAAPVVNNLGECAITISIVLPEVKAIQRERYYTDAVQAAAARIEASLGWRSAPAASVAP